MVAEYVRFSRWRRLSGGTRNCRDRSCDDDIWRDRPPIRTGRSSLTLTSNSEDFEHGRLGIFTTRKAPRRKIHLSSRYYTMSTSDPSTSDSLTMVNSFYGPGATACWYLTCFSCLISWTFHPQKRTSDSITSDFIALVTFPTVAAVHLLSQVQNYPSQPSLDEQLSKQIHASMSASLTITETYLTLCMILLAPTVLMQSMKRIVLLAFVGLLCVASETYVFFAVPSIRNKAGVFNRSFIIDSLPTLIAILGLAFILVLMLLYFIVLTFDRPPPRAEAPSDADPEVISVYRLANEAHDLRIQDRRLTYMAIWFLPLGALSGGLSTFQALVDLVPSLARSLGRIVPTGRSLVHEFFPATDTSIMDLDQAVALLAGMTVLGFNLYSTAEERYKAWWEEQKESRESAARRIVEIRAEAAASRRARLADEAAHRSSSEAVELSDLQNLGRNEPVIDTLSGLGTVATA